ncbi:formylglycine-generating enzyme family protein [Halopseudomonas yangmingensis]|uniref:Formylglycine-generating enzyme, required for sulfatase activity, contains SUMF1/FGE domain n=1 Tax=Halopseudomonas yangmingensis TaxID=1720063 RepID=A0A1I4RQ37_9GAMM|nr:formylglycine-generating enzyme family protein [Halopseudomonas yangmingensis]SFM54377.1 Formylglycine-generating enzyme, required for sulfatase activity, contains SUMF1/FGE domain [Halopseudomonas yangmingensis]
MINTRPLSSLGLLLGLLAAPALAEQTVPQPDMITIPAGSFMMGCDHRHHCHSREMPVRKVEVAAFEIGRYEVTFAEWDACVADGACTHSPSDQGWGRDQRPVISVSFDDVTNQFLPWLNQRTGSNYRLPSEAEWEYVARAGTTTQFFNGNCLTSDQANFDGRRPHFNCPVSDFRNQTLPVGSFDANAFGVHDMHGNVWEWVADCARSDYKQAPANAAPLLEGYCERRMIRGGSWGLDGWASRSTYRYSFFPRTRENNGGFRLARSID